MTYRSGMLTWTGGGGGVTDGDKGDVIVASSGTVQDRVIDTTQTVV